MPVFGTVAGVPPDGRQDAGPACDFLIGVADAAASRHRILVVPQVGGCTAAPSTCRRLRSRIPPLTALLDHVLVSEEWTVHDVGEFHVPGSDDRGVQAKLQLRP